MFILKFIFSAFKLTLEIFCLVLLMNFMSFPTETEWQRHIAAFERCQYLSSHIVMDIVNCMVEFKYQLL